MRHAKLSLARRGPSTHEAPRVHHAARQRGCVAAADADAAAHDANGWRIGGTANRMRAWPCPMLMTRRKIIAQTTIGNETRPIKAKLRNASCLWDTHRRSLWVLDFIRRSPPRPWNIVQHDCGNVNDQRRNHRPPQKCGLPSKLSRALAVAVDPISNTISPLENSAS